MIRWPFQSSTSIHHLQVDFHSHLIPGVDDGVISASETMQLLTCFKQLGYQKVITTPHIYPEVYANKEEQLIKQYQALCAELEAQGLSIEFELAAEYYLHEDLLKKVKSKKKLLSFSHQNYVLFETGFHQRPMIWDELIFELLMQGYKPVLAHPERYAYVSENPALVRTWRDQGLKMQLNISSVLGLYGKEVQRTAKTLVKDGQIDFLCSDIHRVDQQAILLRAAKHKLFQQAAALAQNNDLL